MANDPHQTSGGQSSQPADPNDSGPDLANLASGSHMPNRDRRREPPVIDAVADDVHTGPAPESSAEPERAAEGAEGEASDGPDAPANPSAQTHSLKGARIITAGSILAVVALGFLAVSGFILFEGEKSGLGDLQSKVAALAGKLDDFEARTAEAPARDSLAAFEKRIAALDADQQRMRKDFADLAQKTAAADAAAREALAKTDEPSSRETRSDNGRSPAGGIDATALQARVTEIEKRIASLESQLESQKTEVRATESRNETAVMINAAPLAVSAQALIQSLDRGLPYAAELDAVQSLGADPSKIAALRPLAAKGVPTVRMLAEDFARFESPILAPADDKQLRSFFDRALAFLTHLVRIRPVGEQQGDDPASLVSRIETALARGRIEDALAAWERLPLTAKTLSQAWADEAKSRALAEASAQAILTDAITSLGRAKS